MSFSILTTSKWPVVSCYLSLVSLVRSVRATTVSGTEAHLCLSTQSVTLLSLVSGTLFSKSLSIVLPDQTYGIHVTKDTTLFAYGKYAFLKSYGMKCSK